MNYNSRRQYPFKIRIRFKILLAGWHIQFLYICLKYPSSQQVKYVLVYPLKWYALFMPYILSQKNGYRNLWLPAANVWMPQDRMWYLLLFSGMPTCLRHCLLWKPKDKFNQAGNYTSRHAGKIPLLEEGGKYWNENIFVGRNRLKYERN